MAAGAGAFIGMAAGSALTSMAASYAKGAEYKIQQYQAETNAKIAAMQGRKTAMDLSSAFNKSMASDVVMAAAQGRRGGSVQAVAGAAEKQFNWDVDFAAMSANIQETGYLGQAEQYGMAGKYAQGAGMLSAGMQSATKSYVQYSLLKKK